jgi:undecaprenyl-diphosphatase
VSVFQAFILGLVQGATEFLPISSSGHLILVPWLFDWTYLLRHPEVNKSFDVALHLGTFLSLIAFFWRQIGELLAAWGRSIARRRIDTPNARLAWLLVVSTIPAGVLGVLFESVIEDKIGQPWIIAVMMIVFAGVMYAVDRLARLQRGIANAKFGDAVILGFAQAVALIPGVSRSGITIVTGMGLKFTREAAARYSFLMSIPIVGGAAAYKALEAAKEGLPAGMALPFAVGTLTAALSGFAAVWFLLAYLKRHDLTPFVIYRLVVGVAILIVIATGVRSASGL